MSATPVWMLIISSWASAAAPVVPDPVLVPAQADLLRVRAAHPVQGDLLLRVWAAHPAQGDLLLRVWVAHPAQGDLLLRVWVAHLVQADLLRVEHLMVTAMRRFPVWW